MGLRDIIKRLTGRIDAPTAPLAITTIKRGNGWLAERLSPSFRVPVYNIATIAERARLTEEAGALPLWDGYRSVEHYPRDTHGSRSSQEVRSDDQLGAFYIWLAQNRAPDLIVEFGTAFGVSGMYWLTGLGGRGGLMTYEPNEAWSKLARANLTAIAPNFTLTNGTFEEKASATLQPITVDIAFIDAIHTSEFVFAQYAVLKPFLKPGALVVCDDINFSDDMRQCWLTLANQTDVRASFELGERAGILELK